MANSRVDLPQPDSPTTPMNSPAERSKLTWSTASTVPRSRRYSTDRSRTSRMVPEAGAAGLAGELSSGTLGTHPLYAPSRPEGRVADLVEGVVEQRERRPQSDDAQAGRDDPQWRDLERLVVLGQYSIVPQLVTFGSPSPMNCKPAENSTAYSALVRKAATSSEVIVGMISTQMMYSGRSPRTFAALRKSRLRSDNA